MLECKVHVQRNLLTGDAGVQQSHDEQQIRPGWAETNSATAKDAASCNACLSNESHSTQLRPVAQAENLSFLREGLGLASEVQARLKAEEPLGAF